MDITIEFNFVAISGTYFYLISFRFNVECVNKPFNRTYEVHFKSILLFFIVLRHKFIVVADIEKMYR